MTHSAYRISGSWNEAFGAISHFVTETLGLDSGEDTRVEVYRYTQCSVEEARKFQEKVYTGAGGARGRVLILSTERFFHEAQNALLKVFEEPPEGIVLILHIPQPSILLPTLRSRLQTLTATHAIETVQISASVQAFLESSSTTQEKLIAKLVDAAKSDSDEVKQRARADVVHLVEGMVQHIHRIAAGKPTDVQRAFLEDALVFLPLLHQRSAPIKLILEHLRLLIAHIPRV